MTTDTRTPTITIREATATDVEELVRMMGRFHAESIYHAHFPFNADFLRVFIPTVLAGGAGTAFVADAGTALVGMLAVATCPHLMSGQTVAMELCWWMEPEVRGGRAALRLIRAAEAWAATRGAFALQLAAPDDRVGAFYERLGYERLEAHYQRRVGPWQEEQACRE